MMGQLQRSVGSVPQPSVGTAAPGLGIPTPGLPGGGSGVDLSAPSIGPVRPSHRPTVPDTTRPSTWYQTAARSGMDNLVSLQGPGVPKEATDLPPRDLSVWPGPSPYIGRPWKPDIAGRAWLKYHGERQITEVIPFRVAIVGTFRQAYLARSYGAVHNKFNASAVNRAIPGVFVPTSQLSQFGGRGTA